MKKQRKDRFYESLGGLFAIIFVGFLVAGTAILIHGDAKPQFNITRTVCHNETIINNSLIGQNILHEEAYIYYTFRPRESINPKYFIDGRNILGFDSKTMEIDYIDYISSTTKYINSEGEIREYHGFENQYGEQIELGNGLNLEEIYNPSDFTIVANIKVRVGLINNTYTLSNYTKEVCEQKDVDELTVFSYATNQKGCDNNLVEDVCPKEALVLGNWSKTCCFRNINKENLTKQWLKMYGQCLDKPYGVSTCTKEIPIDCYIKRDTNQGPEILDSINSSRPECLDCGQTYIYPEDCTKWKIGDYEVTER